MREIVKWCLVLPATLCRCNHYTQQLTACNIIRRRKFFSRKLYRGIYYLHSTPPVLGAVSIIHTTVNNTIANIKYLSTTYPQVLIVQCAIANPLALPARSHTPTPYPYLLYVTITVTYPHPQKIRVANYLDGDHLYNFLKNLHLVANN